MIMKQSDVIKVRNAVTNYVGKKVRIRANKGRHKIDITEGIISEAYPSIFLIRIDDGEEDSNKIVTFSYTDVLTKDVQLTLCNEV